MPIDDESSAISVAPSSRRTEDSSTVTNSRAVENVSLISPRVTTSDIKVMSATDAADETGQRCTGSFAPNKLYFVNTELYFSGRCLEIGNATS